MFGLRNESASSQVFGTANLYFSIEGYLDCSGALGLSQTANFSKFFPQHTNGETKKNKYWKERYERYFGEISGTHKCYEQRFRDQYEHVAQ